MNNSTFKFKPDDVIECKGNLYIVAKLWRFKNPDRNGYTLVPLPERFGSFYYPCNKLDSIAEYKCTRSEYLW